eukprot:jgi/Botrbrau1/5524/Bobra.0023s0011.1
MSRGLAVYRILMRTVNNVFKDDDTAIQLARRDIRSQFTANRLASGPELDGMFAAGEEAASFLRSCVVQARLNDRGNYEMKIEKHHTGAVAEEAAIRPPRPPLDK